MMAEFARRHVERKQRWGRIVNVSADCSEGCPAEVSYRASKYALESYSRSAAAELGPFGITVNIVSPGPIQTGYIAPEMEEELIRDIPLRRVDQPSDIADAIVFLASDQARWITGQLLCVHGGHRMSLGLSARGERENSGLKTPFLTVKTTGETPVPQFCHGLLGDHTPWGGTSGRPVDGASGHRLDKPRPSRPCRAGRRSDTARSASCPA